MTTTEVFFAVVSVIVRAGTVASVIYLGIGARTIETGVSVCNIALAASIWRTGNWFIVTVAWGHSVWVVVIDVIMLGLIYCGVRAGTVATRVLGRGITLDASSCRTRPWFIVTVDWSHGVWVVVVDVGVLGYMLVWVG